MRLSMMMLCTALASPAMADVPRVVAGTPVTGSLVSMVMGDLGTPAVLLDSGGDPHSFQLRPSQARALAEADVVVWVGPELTPWMQRAIDGTGTGGMVLTLLEVPGLTLMGFGDGHDHGDDHAHEGDHGHDHGDDHAHEGDHGHDHGDDHAHEGDHGHDHGDDHAHEGDHGHDHGDDHAHEGDHGHDHGDDHAHEGDHGHDHGHDGTDPHAWMYPHNAKLWIDAIAGALGNADPANASTYAANAEAARNQISAIEAEVTELLAPVGDAALVMFHDAYGYFGARFGLNIAGTVTLGDAAAPGAARLTEIRAMLAEKDVVCVFPEVNHSSRYVDVVVEGTGVRVGGLLDPAGVTYDNGPDLYGQLMRGLATGIADCVTPG